MRLPTENEVLEILTERAENYDDKVINSYALHPTVGLDSERLFSFRNPENERKVAEIIHDMNKSIHV